MVSRHRLIERFLTDVVGVPWDDVHEEAEHLEHAMSPRFEAYVLSAVGDAATCPHGHPIRPGRRIEGVPLADVQEGATVRVLRFENEAEDLLHYLKATGLAPGLEGRVPQLGRERSAWSWPTASRRSPAASPRRSPSRPTRRLRPAPRSPSSWCSAKTATAAELSARGAAVSRARG